MNVNLSEPNKGRINVGDWQSEITNFCVIDLNLTPFIVIDVSTVDRWFQY